MHNALAAVVSVTVAAAAAIPAAAVTYDAFSSFTGTNTGGAFTYGTFDGTGFTTFNDAPGCASLISNVICTSNGFLPAAFKSTSGAHQSGTVIVPANALILHPGANAGQASAVVFTAPVAAKYKLNFSAFVADTNPSGVHLVSFSPGFFTTPVGSLSAVNPSFSGMQTSFVPAGLQIGLAVDYAGLYYNDSTGVNFTVTQVPEPASWALMIAGFAMIGFAARRRQPTATA